MDKWNDKATYKKINRIIDIISAVLMLGLMIVTFVIWKQSPDIVPTHFNFKGEVDSYGSKNTVFIFLIIAVICYLIMVVTSRYPELYNYCIEINPRNKEKQYQMAATFMKIINLEVAAIFLYIQINTASAMLKGSENLSVLFLPVSLLIIFGSIAVYIRKSIKNK